MRILGDIIEDKVSWIYCLGCANLGTKDPIKIDVPLTNFISDDNAQIQIWNCPDCGAAVTMPYYSDDELIGVVESANAHAVKKLQDKKGLKKKEKKK